MTPAGIKKSHKHDKQDFTQGDNSKLDFCYSTLCRHPEPRLSHRRRQGPADCAERLNKIPYKIPHSYPLKGAVMFY